MVGDVQLCQHRRVGDHRAGHDEGLPVITVIVAPMFPGRAQRDVQIGSGHEVAQQPGRDLYKVRLVRDLPSLDW